mmetsp:Transcript_25043/g.48714  ORF Transcript_25043/g.48714 Transcript_25043/m.48714 type:complete len:445 (+) Transcript_25043:277-1611(+)
MCRCVDKPRHAPGLAGAPAAQQQQHLQAKVQAPVDLEGMGWRNPFNPSDAFGEAFDFWSAPTAAASSVATSGSPADSSYTSESQAATPLQGEETDEWACSKQDTFEPSNYFDGFAPDAFFRDLASSFNDETELAPAPVEAVAVAPAMAPQMSVPAHCPSEPMAALVPSTLFQAPAMHIEQRPSQCLEAFTGELLFPAPHPISEARAPGQPKAKAPAQAAAKQAIVKAEASAAAEGDKVCKWKRRDIAKHLAGERSRRAKRMGKVHHLQALVEGLPHKPTVNQILAAAIAQIKQAKSEPAAPVLAAPAPAAASAGGVDFREGFRASSYARTMVLDENHCVVEASSAMLAALQWPGQEDTIKGQYIASVMHPEDACALVGEAQGFRASGMGDSSVQAVRTVVSFMGFVPMPGLGDCGGCLAFPRGYMPQAVVDVTINSRTMFICVP